MPDVDGDTPGVRKGRTKAWLEATQKTVTQTLPEHLKVRLGETVRVGDLEVTPTRVERGRVSILTEGAEEHPEPSPHDALLLHLRLKNVARDYAFTPLDNYFDRRWKSGDGPPVPFTLLQAGRETFFGGPARWYPLGVPLARRERRDWLAGRKNIDRRGLEPGEEAETYLATDGWDPAVAAYLFGAAGDGRAGRPYRGPLLWRVQLRRGLVGHEGRELPATAVIGVEFSDRAYARGAGRRGKGRRHNEILFLLESAKNPIARRRCPRIIELRG